MDAAQERFEQIEQYLTGELEGEALTLFEEQLRSDPGLAREVALHGGIAEALTEADVPELQGKLQAAHERFMEKEALPRKRYFGKALRIAASVALLASITWAIYSINKPADSDALFVDYFEAYEARSYLRSQGSFGNKTLREAYKNYEQQNYVAALPYFEETLEDSMQLSVAFFTANCYLGTNQAEKAIPLFRQVIADSDNLLVQQAQWYLALAYMKEERKEERDQLLTVLMGGTGKYAEKARQLYEELH